MLNPYFTDAMVSKILQFLIYRGNYSYLQQETKWRARGGELRLFQDSVLSGISLVLQAKVLSLQLPRYVYDRMRLSSRRVPWFSYPIYRYVAYVQDHNPRCPSSPSNIYMYKRNPIRSGLNKNFLETEMSIPLLIYELYSFILHQSTEILRISF